MKQAKKGISLFLILAMLCSMCMTTVFAAGSDEEVLDDPTAVVDAIEEVVDDTEDVETVAADEEDTETESAAIWWTDAGAGYDTSWYDDSATTFTIADAADLAGLSYLVMNGTTFSGKTVQLGANIDLSGYLWTPIGGDGTYSGSVPNGNAFEGTFDGNNYTINNLNIEWNVGDTIPSGSTVASSTNYAGLGLFGSVEGGTIQNVTVAGNIETDARTYCVGGIVGYLSGNAFNCHNKVAITISNTTPSQCGGIAGTAENTDTTKTTYIQFCSNTANIQGRGRNGGIVGAVYCTAAGGVVVDRCYNTGNITSYSSSSKAYTGGIAGYCRGYIQNCYSIATMTANGGHYLAGLVGLLQGSSPQASLSNCYTVPTFVNATYSYDRIAFGSVDSSTTLPITSVLWVSDGSSIDQPDGTVTAKWGYWTTSGEVTSAALQSSTTTVTALTTDTENTSEMISTTDKTALEILGAAFTSDTSNLNGGYPVLAWQVNGVSSADFGNLNIDSGGSTTTDTVYLGGSHSGAYTDLASALDAVDANGTVIVEGTTSITEAMTRNDNVTIQRGDDFTGTMFIVDAGSGNIVRLTTMTIDGGGSGTIFEVTSGTLNLRGGVTLENCDTAVIVNGGALEINKASIEESEYSVHVKSGSFTLNDYGGTTISGAVYLADGTYITLSTALTETLKVTTVTTTSGTVIASCASNAIANSSLSYLSVNDGTVTVERAGANIVIS